MATNYVSDGKQISLNVGTGKNSGDPIAIGNIRGICLSDADTDGNAAVVTVGIVNLSVKGWDGTANAAIAFGDSVYLDTTAGTLDVNTAKTLYGTALEPVVSGATTTIEVFIKR